MKKIDFLIFYEHKNREFESIVLLKHELVNRGFTVEICSFYENNPSKLKRIYNNVNVVIMPSLYNDEEILNIVYAFVGQAKSIVNLRWEQLFSNITEKNTDYYVFPKEHAKNGYHCCWGERPYQMLIDTGVDSDKLKITGAMHLDFLRNDLKKVYLNRQELFSRYSINNEKKCILFISSFSMSTLGKRYLDKYLLQFGSEERKQIEEFIIRETESRFQITDWLIRLAKSRDYTIVYRPHPAEDNTETLERLKSIKNIKVISEHNVKQWILTCDQVLSWYSTSVVEASVAGVPCAVLRPVDIDVNDDIAIFDDFLFIKNFQQLCDYCDNNVNEKVSMFVDMKTLNKYYDIDSSSPSYKRTADYLVDVYTNEYYFPWDCFSKKELSFIRKKRKKQKVQSTMSKIFIKPFYHNYPMMRILSRICGKLCARYSSIVHNKQYFISKEEFDELEGKLTAILNNS